MIAVQVQSRFWFIEPNKDTHENVSDIQYYSPEDFDENLNESCKRESKYVLKRSDSLGDKHTDLCCNKNIQVILSLLALESRNEWE